MAHRSRFRAPQYPVTPTTGHSIFTRTDGAHGVEICLSAADIPNTTFARTSMLLMFESCNETPGCDRDCVSLRSGSGTVHLRAKSPSSSILTPSYSFTAL